MRPSIVETMLETAQVQANRSTCVRRKVGCVITDRNNNILATGYNGVPANYEHCTEKACLGSTSVSGKDLDSCNAIHAEQNAIARLREYDKAVNMYCTTKPCISCLKLILATGITDIYYIHEYNNNSTLYKLIRMHKCLNKNIS